MNETPIQAPESIRVLQSFCRHHYVALATLILILTAFNLTFRLDREFVDEWDESLYATSAWEMLDSGQWAATTFHGALDYYNSKPPLNVWAIALSMQALGPGLVAIRLPSVLCAWLTVGVLMLASRRWYGPMVSLGAGLVLATCFGFLYVHSGRSANCDAAFTLVILLVVVTLVEGCTRPGRLTWLGPLLAAAFLLKGTGVLLPAAIAGMVIVLRRDAAWRAPLYAAAVGFVLPVGAWIAARWQVDGWLFLRAMVSNDLVSITTTAMDGHRGGPLYYLNVLQKHHYEWLLVATAALVLYRLPWTEVRRALSFWRPGAAPAHLAIGAWVTAAIVIPTLMQTKLAWYLNPFYPAFALGVAWVVARAVARPAGGIRPLVALVCLALIVVEARVVWYSYAFRDIERSTQALLFLERERLRGSRVYQRQWGHAERFVVTALVGGRVEISDPIVTGGSGYILARRDAHMDAYAAVRCQMDLCLYSTEPLLSDTETSNPPALPSP